MSEMRIPVFLDIDNVLSCQIWRRYARSVLIRPGDTCLNRKEINPAIAHCLKDILLKIEQQYSLKIDIIISSHWRNIDLDKTYEIISQYFDAFQIDHLPLNPGNEKDRSQLIQEYLDHSNPVLSIALDDANLQVNHKSFMHIQPDCALTPRDIYRLEAMIPHIIHGLPGIPGSM